MPGWPPRLRAGVALAHALACLMREDPAGAVEAAWRQHACYVEDGARSRFGQLSAEMNVAIYECLRGNYDESIERLERVSEEFLSLVGPARQPALVRSNLAIALLLRGGPGDHARGVEVARDVWARYQRQGENIGPIMSALALAQARRGAFYQAVRVLGYLEARLAAEGAVYGWFRRRNEEVRAMCVRVGAAQFDAWYETGRALDEEAATRLAFALD